MSEDQVSPPAARHRELLEAAEWAVGLIDRLLATGQIRLSDRRLDELARAKAAIRQAKTADEE